MKILVYGSLNIDLIFAVDHIVMPGETMSSGAFSKGAGGKGANQAAAAALAGLPVFMAGKIGQDGEFLLRLLESYGVDTGKVVRYDGATGQALIQVDKNGQNAIVLASGGNGAVTSEEIRATMADFGSEDILVVQNEIAGVSEIIRTANERGMQVCFNPSPYNEKIEALPLEMVNLFFVNEIEGAALARLSSDVAPDAILNQLVKRFPSAEIILTAGGDGAYYAFGSARVKGEIVSMPVVDTTGAGDTFTGYYIAARQRKFSVQDALNAACKAASIAVSRAG
ncbi:MAG: PfkB family carbohydrate kinase, partial [Treponema sp.]|nr:PfkB family carbohydrate kinase [Treponema sp.]